jgi:2-iminobutanoate/2-iminopropanoate deaminase
MKKTVIRTDRAPAPGGSYSQGIAAGPWVFTAGVGPHDPASGAIVGSTIEEQTQQALLNLEAILSARELSRDDIVKVTVHLEELDRDFAGFDAAYRRFFRDPFPVRTTVGSRLDGILLEIDCIAVLDANQ